MVHRVPDITRKSARSRVRESGTPRAEASIMPPALHLTIVDTRTGARRDETFHRLPVRLGRHNLNDCLVDASEASRFHALIRVAPDGGGLELVDLGSRNGTTVEGVRLHADDPVRLRFGEDAFRIGALRFDVRAAPAIEYLRPSLAPPRDDLDPHRAALLVLRRLAELYVPQAKRLQTTHEVLAFGSRLRDALDGLATHYALAPRPFPMTPPLRVVQSLLDPKHAQRALAELDDDLADAHLREQRLLRGLDQGLALLLGHAGVTVEDYLAAHGDTFGPAWAELRDRLDEDRTPSEQVA